MIYHAGMYRGDAVEWGVGLQQLMRRDGVPVLFACLGQEVPDRKEQTEERAAEATAGVTVAGMTDWFYDTALGLCGKGREAHCTNLVYQTFCNMCGLRKNKRTGLSIHPGMGAATGSAAVFFAMGAECFYAWRGQAGIVCFQMFFDRVKGRWLTRPGVTEQEPGAETWHCERAVWEAHAGILLGSNAFLNVVEQRERELAECLRMTDIQSTERMKRHLQELGMCVEQQVRREAVAIFCMPL